MDDRGNEGVAYHNHAHAAPVIKHGFEDALETTVSVDLVLVRPPEYTAEEAEQVNVVWLASCQQSAV